jgi:hypothetical protein
MAIDVQWEELRWSYKPDEPLDSHPLRILRDEESLVERFLIDFRVAELPYLRFIGRDTVTVFHQQQIPQLIKELETLCEQDHEQNVKKHLHAVLELVRAADGSPHTLIAFRAR